MLVVVRESVIEQWQGSDYKMCKLKVVFFSAGW
jgi:hypothetical protein